MQIEFIYKYIFPRKYLISQAEQLCNILDMSAAWLWNLKYHCLCRASTPVFTCAFSMLVENQRPSTNEGLALVIITIGVITALWKSSAAGSTSSIVMCLFSTICNAGMMSMSGKVLSEDIGALQLAF